MTFANYDEYSGEWQKGKMNGKGKYRFWSDIKDDFDAQYEGQFKDNLFHGYGKMRYTDGSFYCGQWINGKRDGYGQLYYKLKSEVKEEKEKREKRKIDNSIEIGHRKEELVNIMSGIWHEDSFIEGVLLLHNGEMFVGGFANLRFEGSGKLFLLDGTLIQGNWKDNCLIEGIAVTPLGEKKKIIDNKVVY